MLRDDILKALPGNLDQSAIELSTLAEIFDAITSMIVVKSLRESDFGRFLIWNKAAERILGIPGHEAIGRSDADFFPLEQAEFFRAKDREVMQLGTPLRIEEEKIHSRELGERVLSTVKTPIADALGKPVALISVSEDITDHRKVEGRLQNALDFLQNVNSQLPGAVYQFEVDTQGRARFPYVSEGIRHVTGDEAGDIMAGQVSLLSRIIPDDLPGFLSAVARSRREMSDCRQEFRLLNRNGEIRWAQASSSPKHQADGSTIWHGFITDISNIKQASEALRRGEERLHRALEATGATAWEINYATGEVYVSPEWGRMFRFGAKDFPRDVVGMFGLVHRHDAEVAQALLDALSTEAGGQVEFRHRCGDGTYLWVLASGKPVFDEEGLILRQVGTLIDISERKRMEQQLIEAKEAAERASLAKGEFLAMMSHEIRTPLNAVLGFSELLSATALSSEQEDFLKTIQDNSSALLVILNDVLDYSKIESGKLDMHFSPVDMSRVIRAAVEVFRPLAMAKGVALKSQLSDRVPEFLICDPARMSQVIHNLLSNAVKFTESGEVVVELSVEGREEEGTWPVKLSVKDTGIGIDLDQHRSLFDPFYQVDSSTKRRRGGTGLGLAIVKRLVDLMGGHINVQSTAGKGTNFTVTLSLDAPVEEDPLAGDQKKRMSMNLSGLMKKILLIEDNATNRRLVRLFLNKLGYASDEADNGFEGVRLAGLTSYDVIFMDLEMPGMDGYEATRRIRQHRNGQSPYIVALTAHALPEYREKSFAAGMDAYLSKPIKLADLAKTLREAFP